MSAATSPRSRVSSRALRREWWLTSDPALRRRERAYRDRFPAFARQYADVLGADHHYRHVVAAAIVERLLDQCIGGGRRIGDARGQQGSDLVVLDFVAEPVAAQQEHVAIADLQRQPFQIAFFVP